MNLSVSTIVVKLHEPSRNKREIIEEAMVNYSRAFQFLLESASSNLEAIEEVYESNKGKYIVNHMAKWIDVNLDKELNKFNIEPFKDSIKMDFAATITGYLKLKKNGNFVKYPTVYIEKDILEKEYENMMKNYVEGNIESEVLADRVNKLLHKSENLRPIFFCRYSAKRNYSLLYDSGKDRYYAKIYLMNGKNERRKKPISIKEKELRYIDKNKEIFKEKGSKRSFLIVPLSFGRYQEKYLKEAMENPEILKTARLIKNKDDFYLSINIVKKTTEVTDAKTYFGISRGINNAINYSIVDGEGNIIKEGFENIDNTQGINGIHKTANSIVKEAEEKKSQVVMENLIGKGDKLLWQGKDENQVIPSISCKRYNELYNILNYKLINNGLPKVVRVSSVAIFYTCPKCGVYSKANRFSDKILICTACGFSIDIERVGSLNLSRRLIKYKKDTIKIKVENTDEGLRFTNKDLDFQYYPTNPYECVDEFQEKIDKNIKDFYDNIDEEAKKVNFKKKYSLIKKIEEHKDIFELI